MTPVFPEPVLPRELVERHLAFWQREEVDRPLRVDRRIQPYWVSVRGMYAERDRENLRPEEADADRYLRAVDWSRIWAPAQADLLAVMLPNPRIPWLEAVAGARVCPHLASDSVWAGEPKQPVEGRTRLDPNDVWLAALLAHLRRLAERIPSSLPLSQTLMRGPGDVLEALLGAERLLLAMMDGADWLGPLIDSATDLFIQVAQAQWDLIPPWGGGSVNFFGFWSPQPCVRLQEDVQRILTPALYRDWLRPALARIVRAFPLSMFHIHSGSLHLVEEVVTVPGLSGLQIAIDEPPYAPPITESLEVLRRVQEHVPIFIEGPMTDEELHRLQSDLSPRGLAIQRVQVWRNR